MKRTLVRGKRKVLCGDWRGEARRCEAMRENQCMPAASSHARGIQHCVCTTHGVISRPQPAGPTLLHGSSAWKAGSARGAAFPVVTCYFATLLQYSVSALWCQDPKPPKQQKPHVGGVGLAVPWHLALTTPYYSKVFCKRTCYYGTCASTAAWKIGPCNCY